jgi:hypothetical protein
MTFQFSDSSGDHCDDPANLVMTLTTLVHDLVMPLITIGEGLVTILMTTGDNIVMSHHDDTNNFCGNTDDSR